MLSITVIFTFVLLGLANAQSNSSLTLPPGVDSTDKTNWCIAEQNVCPVLCGPTNLKASCIAAEIPKYECVCGDGNPPKNIEKYVGTVPNSICLAQFAFCRKQNPGSKSCVECEQLKPSLVASAPPSSTSSSSSSSTSASSVTSAATSATATPGAAGRISREIGGVAMGVAAAVGMLL